MTDNKVGIYLYGSTFNSISDNSIVNNGGAGLWYFGSSHNNMLSNNVADNQISMYFELQCRNNTIYHNNFVNNELQFFPDIDSVNSWDNGVEGNYWSNYNGTDDDGNGIGDTQYVIDENNQDNYPLITEYIIPEFPSPTSTPEPDPFPTTLVVASIATIAVIVIGILVYFKKFRK